MAARDVNIEHYRKQYKTHNITCRIPTEILTTVFCELVHIAHNDPWYRHAEQCPDGYPMRWVRAVSHVCSHWRSVALSTPALWSNLPMNNPRWAWEMIARSKWTSLIVDYNGMFETAISSRVHTSYSVLTEVLKSHLSRVERLVLRLKFMMSNLDRGCNNFFRRQRKLEEESAEEEFAGLFTLAKQPASFMEHLELHVEPSEKNMLPNSMVVGFLKLQVLILEGCSMDWDLPRFRNLKTLSLSRIPWHLMPSMTQLLDILSQTPLIETLHVSEIKDSVGQGGISSIPISLVHLGSIELSCDLQSSVLFFDNVRFLSKALRIVLEHTVFPPLASLHNSDSSIASMKRLALQIQKHIEGSLVKLMLRGKFLCCCFRSSWSQEPTRRIEIDLREHGEFSIALENVFWQSLRVDRLIHLEIDDFRLNKNAWVMFGDLPLLEELFVRSNECPLLEVLSRGGGMAGIPPSFVALKRLITFGWTLHEPGSLAGETVATQMINCFRSRKSMGLHLESISLEESRIDNQILAELRKIVAEVYVDSDDWNLGVDSESGKESSDWETDFED